MKNLLGYVRSIDIYSDSCTVEKPNLYSHHSGTVREAQIEIDNLCEELVDYLECTSRPMNNKGNGITRSIISLWELTFKYDEVIEANKHKMNEFLFQLDKLIVMCDSIARLGVLNLDELYLMFDIKQTTKA